METISLAKFEKILNFFLSSIEEINEGASGSWEDWQDAENIFYICNDFIDENDDNNITLFDSYDKEDNEYEKECFFDLKEAYQIFDNAIASKGKSLINDLSKLDKKFYDEFYSSRIFETAKYLEKNL